MQVEQVERRRLVTERRSSARGTVITMSGSLDDASAAMAECYLDAELTAGRGDIIFDLRSLDVETPSGARLLLRAHRHLTVQGRRVVFEGLFGGTDRALATLPVR
jgi:anti-anti-sigma regulatory factor